MLKNKRILLTILLVLLLIFLPNMVKATVDVTRNIYANNGSAKYNFTGLTLDKSHEYEFGFTKTSATEVTKWYLITEYTETTATIDIRTANTEFADIITAVDTGYITIRDKTDTTTIVLDHYPIDLTVSYLNITNYNVINNGKYFGGLDRIRVNLWDFSNSEAYYQYEKITDEKVINKFKEIKAGNGNYDDLQSLLKTSAPSFNWNEWKFWGGDGGYPQTTISVPDEGLYYMWIYIAGKDIKNLYGYILVDNLQHEIALDSISLPKTKEVEMGKTITLTPTFEPETTTNKIVTWSSSDESIATVDNAGRITPKKIGSTIITVTSQDGNKKATCTVTVVEKSTEPGNTVADEPKNEQKNNKNNSVKNTVDNTIAPGTMPYTGGTFFIILTVLGIISVAIYVYKRNNDLKGI